MDLLSFGYFSFLAITLLLYNVLPAKIRKHVFLISSFIFYYYEASLVGTVSFLCYLLLLALGIRIIQNDEKISQKIKKIVYWFILIFDVLSLVLWKYNHLLPIDTPIGMSYWMITGIGFMTQCYWGGVKNKLSVSDSVLLCSFFPLIISDPIVTWDNTGIQLVNGNKSNYQNLTFGAQRIVWGAFKKLVIAERLAVLVNSIFIYWDTKGRLELVLGIVLFTLQLYCDFGGAMDIVLGSAELFGICLPENFKTPFYSKTISEFWRRWHITLGVWLKEFVL